MALCLMAAAATGFQAAAVWSSSLRGSLRHGTPLAAVVELDNLEAFEKALSDAGDKIVMVDYMTTFCQPWAMAARSSDPITLPHAQL